MNILIKPINLSKPQKDSLARKVSFSVDCDSLAHYINFASPGTKVENDRYSYLVMCRNILDIFKKYNVKATFFCIADQLEDPAVLDIFREIVNSGHEIGNHTFSHPEIDTLSEADHLNNIRLGHEKIKTLLNVTPVGYRAPAYFITEGALREIAGLGYLYDSSLCYSKITSSMIRLLEIISSGFRPKKQSPLLRRFKGKGPYEIEFSDRQKLLEWPIPNIGGLAYYGTLHCCVPRSVFLMQTFMLNFFKRYIHYAFHPIEVITDECREEFPWINKIPFSGRDDLSEWLEYRVKKLTATREVVTLKELSKAHIGFY